MQRAYQTLAVLAEDEQAALRIIAHEVQGFLEAGAIAELAATALKHVEKAERRLDAYCSQLGGGASL